MQRKGYEGRIFDVLGTAFSDVPLRDLLVEAIQYGERPEVRARLSRWSNAQVADGSERAARERALHDDVRPVLLPDPARRPARPGGRGRPGAERAAGMGRVDLRPRRRVRRVHRQVRRPADPGDSAPLAVTGTSLLVRPGAALAQQRATEDAERTPSAESSGSPFTPSSAFAGTPSVASTATAPGTAPLTSSVPQPAHKTRFFGVRTLDPQRYGRDFQVVFEEVLQRLSAADAQLEVRLEIFATSPSGFGDDVVRTVSENAAALRFEQPGFESE